MNAYKRLVLEVNGIRGIIEDYTSAAYTQNFLDQLEKGIAERDYSTIIYSLDKLIEWYSDNFNKIANNRYVFNFPEHQKNYDTLGEIRDSITEEDCVESSSTSHTDTPAEVNPPIIFISHRSSDKKYGDALRNFIVGLGVKYNQLIYSSHPLHKIPLDQNIYDYLRTNIHANVFMIILWSNEYLDSPACLNEMGAAWVVQSDYTNIYVPTFSFGNPKYHECAVDTNKMGAVLNGDQHCRASMLELKDKIVSLFDLQVDEQQVMYLLEEFIKEISPK